ncbi:MAG: MarR family transcriptional regulator [Candidatus Heimdallarchaeota archaeon]|nr:MarR family transcriptional regulator [Candidatus Heimdallarchaeota archaeon]
MKSQGAIELDVHQNATHIEIFDLIGSISRDLDRFQRGFVNTLGITPSQFHLLNTMEEDQTYLPSEFADQMNKTRPTITGILDNLEKKELIKRELDPDDRRSFLVSLTSKGIELKKAFPDMSNIFNSCCSDLSSVKLNQLKSLLLELQSSLNTSCLKDVK